MIDSNRISGRILSLAVNAAIGFGLVRLFLLEWPLSTIVLARFPWIFLVGGLSLAAIVGLNLFSVLEQMRKDPLHSDSMVSEFTDLAIPNGFRPYLNWQFWMAGFVAIVLAFAPLPTKPIVADAKPEPLWVAKSPFRDLVPRDSNRNRKTVDGDWFEIEKGASDDAIRRRIEASPNLVRLSGHVFCAEPDRTSFDLSRIQIQRGSSASSKILSVHVVSQIPEPAIPTWHQGQSIEVVGELRYLTMFDPDSEASQFLPTIIALEIRPVPPVEYLTSPPESNGP